MIEVKGVSVTADDFSLEEIDLTVPSGEYAVLLGPTGSGKTVLIETVCGLRRQDGGRIIIGGREVSTREPGERGIGYLPQDYALFDHLSVEENIAFGLRVKGLDGRAIVQRTHELMETLGISALGRRHPATLSGGERQRVALGRALAPRPSVLLLDEPVSALDERMRLNVCGELKEIQRRLGTTTMHISHSFEETRAVASRVIVIMDGRIVQEGDPPDVFARPATKEVALFFGTENLFCGIAEKQGGGSLVTVDGIRFYSTEKGEGILNLFLSHEGIVLTRDDGGAPGRNSFRGEVRAIHPLNHGVRVRLDIGILLTVWASPREVAYLDVREGTKLQVAIDPGAIHYLEA
jgi:molybdate/tungstate transport system ATP-binding protein